MEDSEETKKQKDFIDLFLDAWENLYGHEHTPNYNKYAMTEEIEKNKEIKKLDQISKAFIKQD